MSIKSVETCIERFLSTESPEVLAIRGKWGVGKTFFWNTLLKSKATEPGAISTDKYSYVSLFGINSLDQFKFSIFENTVSNKIIGQDVTLESFSKNLQSVSTSLGRKAVNTLFSTKPLSGFTGAVEAASFLSVRNTLICIDDVERKGNSLSLKDALGLISYLKENRNCKFILLLNEDEEGLNEYKKYREKVVDTELAFSPTPSECVEIAIKNPTPAQILLKEYAISLGMSNIRTLHKTIRLVDMIEPLLDGMEEEILCQAISSIVLFCHCFYRAGDQALPTVEYILAAGNVLYSIGEKEAKSPEERRWNTMLQTYGYTITDQFDRTLAKGVFAGYFDEAAVQELANAKNTEVLDSKASQEFSDAWALYHNTFENNEKELADALCHSLRKNARLISPTNLNSTVLLLRELGRTEEASELIDHYIEVRKDHTKIFNLSDYAFGGDVTDQEIRDKFAVKTAEINSKPSLKEVLEKLSSSNGWGQIDEEVLAESSPADYQKIFETEVGDHLDSYVRVGLKFRDYSNGEDLKKQIGINVSSALKEIAKKSELNRRRVRKFGVELDDNT